MKPFYITTPLYYVNDVPHIGHAYTTIAADVLARWRRLKGDEVFFLTGTDEHGSKIAQAAQAAGKTPLAYADRVVEKFQELWKRLGITNDDFIRTSEERHKKVVQTVFERLLKKGDIFLGSYEDWYCVPCETFWSESELNDRKCPTCGRAVEKLKEESYFFKLEDYKERLLAHYRENPEFLQPKHRASEIVNFVKDLKNLSVSRTKVTWGVPVPSNPKHTVYVWFDALLNYISAPGFGADPEKFKARWPADVHLVGKEIYRFHTVIWPAMLMALGLELPKEVFAHGWWTVEGEKMSKSKGNVVDPHKIIDEFGGDGIGVDVLRYFLLKEVSFGSDGDFSRSALLSRYNAELANALGNLLHRTLNLLEKNFGGQIPNILIGPENIRGKFGEAMERLAFHEALEMVFNQVNVGNKIIDTEAPWKAAKEAAALTLWKVLIILKQVTLLLHAFMPSLTLEMWRQLGEKQDLTSAAKAYLTKDVLGFAENQTVKKGSPLFPRKEAKPV